MQHSSLAIVDFVMKATLRMPLYFRNFFRLSCGNDNESRCQHLNKFQPRLCVVVR